MVISSYLEDNMRTTLNEWGTKRLPWEHHLPSNGATKSELYNLIFQKTQRSINFNIDTYLYHEVLVT